MSNKDNGSNGSGPGGDEKKFASDFMEWRPGGAPSALHAAINAEVLQALEGKQFSSEEEFVAFLQHLQDEHNRRPVADFCGLSAEQMYRLLYYPFESPQLVTFPSCLDTPPVAPIISLFAMLAAAIGEQGLKATVRGNLPQKFVREAARAFLGEEKYGEHTRFGGFHSEPDFYDLHVTRLVAGLSGLIRKYKGKFILTGDCRRVLAASGLAGIYPRLLESFARKFNWAYGDDYPDLYFLQQSFLFTLYLFDRFGDQWRPMTFYEEAFVRAFPGFLEEVAPLSYQTQEDLVRRGYSLRCFERFAAFLGLVEIEAEVAGACAPTLLERSFRLRRTPLLGDAVRFHTSVGTAD